MSSKLNKYVVDFIEVYINDFTRLCNATFAPLITCNKMPTSCTIFARVLFYAIFNIDPNGDDKRITSINIDEEGKVDESIRMLMDNFLHKIDIWIDDDVIHSFVIYYEVGIFKIAQSYGDDNVCINPTIYNVDLKSLKQIFKSMIRNDKNSLDSYKILCGLQSDANIDPLVFTNIEITSVSTNGGGIKVRRRKTRRIKVTGKKGRGITRRIKVTRNKKKK